MLEAELKSKEESYAAKLTTANREIEELTAKLRDLGDAHNDARGKLTDGEEAARQREEALRKQLAAKQEVCIVVDRFSTSPQDSEIISVRSKY